MGRDDANAGLFEREEFTERDPQRMRRLGGGVNHDFVEPMIAAGQDGAAFHRRPRLPVHAVFAFDDDFPAARSPLDIAPLDTPLLIQIFSPPLLHPRTPASAWRCTGWPGRTRRDPASAGHPPCAIARRRRHFSFSRSAWLRPPRFHHGDTEGTEESFGAFSRDCFVAVLLAMAAKGTVIASEAKQSRCASPCSPCLRG